MSYRKRPDISTEMRTALTQNLRYAKRRSAEVLDEFHIGIYFANLYGMTLADIAEALGEKSSTIGDWKLKGEQAFRRRSSGDPERSGEREPDCRGSRRTSDQHSG